MRAGQGELAEQLADAVLAVPGVIRLEPTLRNAVRMLSGKAAELARRGHAAAGRPGQATRPGRSSDAVLGVRTVQRGGVVDVRVEIAIDNSRPAATTAADTERALVAALREQNYLSGALAVTILTIETSPCEDAADQ